MIGLAVPGDLEAPTGGYVYARRVMAEWVRQGVAHRAVPLSAAFPVPDAEVLRETRARLAEAPRPLLIDGLAYGAFPAVLAAEADATVLLHHPLCDETGLDAGRAALAFETERAALVHARYVIVTSPLTARDLTARFGVAAERITVAEPGLDPAEPSPLTGDPPHMLAVGSVTPRKGYGFLIEALALCKDLQWTCEIIGATDRDPAATARILAAIDAANLSERLFLRGAVDNTAPSYLSADLFVSPSLHEGYGMAVVEAMAHGLPVITTTAGALAETAPCARLIAPRDSTALAKALRPLIEDRENRLELGKSCRSFAQALPGWDETARIVANALEKI